MKKLIREMLREQLTNCIPLSPTKEVVDYVNKFNSDEELLRSGGLPTEILDRYAFGFTDKDITKLHPDKLAIKWHDDLENVIWEVKKSGLTPKQWSKKVDLSEPVDVSYELTDDGLKFLLEDGHHRYFAAKKLNKLLNINLEIKANPITKISNTLSYDELHRCLFKQIKNIFKYEKITKKIT